MDKKELVKELVELPLIAFRLICIGTCVVIAAKGGKVLLDLAISKVTKKAQQV